VDGVCVDDEVDAVMVGEGAKRGTIEAGVAWNCGTEVDGEEGERSGAWLTDPGSKSCCCCC